MRYAYISSAYLHIKYIKSYEKGDEAPHVRPFTTDVWYTIIAWLIISGICAVFIDYFGIKNIKKSQILNSAFRPFEQFTNQCK